MASKTPNSNDTTAKPDPDEPMELPRLSELSDERKRQIRELLDNLDKTPPEFKDESLAPPVARNVLLSLARGELPEDQARLMYKLVLTFKSWHDAHTEILMEELQRKSE